MFDFIKNKIKNPFSKKDDSKNINENSNEIQNQNFQNLEKSENSEKSEKSENKNNEEQKLSWKQRLFAGLAKTREKFSKKLKTLFSRGKVDDQLLEELEELLLTSDVGVEATMELNKRLKDND